MCLHTLLASYTHCPHYDPIPRDGPGFVVAMKCGPVLEEFRYYHSQADRLPEIYPPPCPRACPPIWGTVECRGNVIIATRPGKCISCSRLDWLTKLSTDLKNSLCKMEGVTENLHQILGEFAKHDEASAEDLLREMKHFIRSHEGLFSHTSLKSMWRAILENGPASAEISSGVDWFFIAFLQLCETWLSPWESATLEAFLQRSHTFRNFLSALPHGNTSSPQSHSRSRSLDGLLCDKSKGNEYRPLSRSDGTCLRAPKEDQTTHKDVSAVKEIQITEGSTLTNSNRVVGHHTRSRSSPPLSRDATEPGISKHRSNLDTKNDTISPSAKTSEPHRTKKDRNNPPPSPRSRRSRNQASKKTKGGKKRRLKPLGRIPQPQYRSDMQMSASTYPWRPCVESHHVGPVRPWIPMPPPPYRMDMEAAMRHAERVMPLMQHWLWDGDDRHDLCGASTRGVF